MISDSRHSLKGLWWWGGRWFWGAFVVPGSQIRRWRRGEVWLPDRSGGALQEEPHGGDFGHRVATQTGEWKDRTPLSFATSSRMCFWNAAFPHFLQDFFFSEAKSEGLSFMKWMTKSFKWEYCYACEGIEFCLWSAEFPGLWELQDKSRNETINALNKNCETLKAAVHRSLPPCP